MKTRILIITIIALMSFSLKSQTFQTLTDTNVIFYDYIPDVVVTNPLIDTLKIDMNQDGILDIQFYLHYYSPGGAYVKTLTVNCNRAFFMTSNTNDSLTSSLLNWGSGDAVWTSFSNYQNRLGVRITDGVNYYYGWIHVTYSVGPQAMTIDKYAFCKIANYPFLYGQTTINTGIHTINSPDSTNVYLGQGNSVMVESGKLIKNVTVTSATGVVVASQNNVNSYSANISTAGIAHGTYIVQVQFTDLTVFTKQIVI